jgi:hypothetical protein
MKTVAKIIAAHGGLERLRQSGNYIRLENPPYMRLVVEHIGQGPRGLPAIAVAHYCEQNGDAIRDPEMVFEVNPDEEGLASWKHGEWCPVSFRQDNLDVYQEAVFLADANQVAICPKLVVHLKEFAREWDRNIEQQGFLKVAQGAQS